MTILTDADKSYLIRLKSYRKTLTAQQYKTLKGQVLAGDVDGARKGLRKLLKRKE